MKKIIYLIALLFAIFSCDNYLEEVPTGGLTADQIYSTPDGIELGLNSVYSTYEWLVGGANGSATDREAGWTLMTLGTDIFTAGQDGGNKSYDRYDEGLKPSNGILSATWDEFYRGINTANAVINRAPEAISNQAVRDNVIAQARFLRGFYYYYLVRTWGAVHYTDEETVGVESEANRTPVDQIYPEIIADFEFAEENLSMENNDGRVTVWAAKTALADVYLTLKEYEKAAQYAEDVINNSPHTLVRPFKDLWEIGNEDNNEVIWATQIADNPAYDNDGNGAHLLFCMEYDKLPGMKRSIEYGRPFKRFRPTDYLYGLYDMEDKRYDGTFLTVWYCNNEANAPDGVELGDTAIWLPRTPLSQAEKDSRPFGINIYNPDEYTSAVYAMTKKWMQPNRPTVNERAGDRDYPVWRLAEVYLMAAEANALKASPDQNKALAYLNEVRMRAYGVTDVSELPVISSVNIDVILEERAKELVAEGKRWFDLVRTGKLVEHVQLYGGASGGNSTMEGRINIKEFHTLRPIPTTQVDRATNDFPQNPGY